MLIRSTPFLSRSTSSSKKCKKQNTILEPVSEIAMLKRCRLLWRDGDLEVRKCLKLTRSDHFWKLRFRKSARPCGTKHLWKWKVQKTVTKGALLAVEMAEKCRLSWCKAHFEVKSVKNRRVWTTFGSCDVYKVHCAVARSTLWSQNVQNTSGSQQFWKLRCRKSARCCGAKLILNLEANI